MEGKEIKYFVLASIVSADNDKYTEEVKQEVMSRMKYEDLDKLDLNYILDPLPKEDKQKYIELLNEDDYIKSHESCKGS